MVTVTFQYEPDEPDEDDPTGMSLEEYEKLTLALMEDHGATNVEVRA